MINFQHLTNVTEKKGWQKAVTEILGSSVAFQWSVADHRAACLLLALPPSAETVLDIACGEGAYSLALAHLCKQVYATDSDPHAVQFLRLRAEQEKVENLFTFIGAPTDIVPQSSLDLILLPQNANTDQIEYLIPLLKPGARICFAATNPRKPFRVHKNGMTKQNIHAFFTHHTLTDIRIFAVYPDIENLHYLIDTEDMRGIDVLFQARLPFIVNNQILKRVAHWAFVHFGTSGYWAYGTITSA